MKLSCNDTRNYLKSRRFERLGGSRLVEQSAAAAESLKQQATWLVEAVSVFRR
jgi:methyl-accepting chemotaxis protein